MDKTLKQIAAANRAILKVRAIKLPNGMEEPGCSLPFDIMFLNAWTQDAIAGTCKAIDEAMEVMEKKHLGTEKNKEGKVVDKVWTTKKLQAFAKEQDKYLSKKVEPALILKSFSLQSFLDMDKDPYWRKINEKRPIPQDYVSLLMEAGLIEDDTKTEK